METFRSMLPFCCANVRTTGQLCRNQAPLRVRDPQGKLLYFCRNHRSHYTKVWTAARAADEALRAQFSVTS